MKSKVFRVVAFFGVLSAVAVAVAPAGAATRGGSSNPPFSPVCANSFAIACIPEPGPYAL
jgi:hypothetical protein